jgi:hypothetical protein
MLETENSGQKNELSLIQNLLCLRGLRFAINHADSKT